MQGIFEGSGGKFYNIILGADIAEMGPTGPCCTGPTGPTGMRGATGAPAIAAAGGWAVNYALPGCRRDSR